MVGVGKVKVIVIERIIFQTKFVPVLTNISRIAEEAFGAAPQLTFTCSKSAIETLEKGVKYVQS